MNGREIAFPKVAGLKSPVHVAVLCPPGAAVTMLLNTMGERGGLFVLMQSIPVPVGGLVKGNGQPNVEIFSMLVFAIQKTEWETWMKTTYDPQCLVPMDAVMTGKFRSAG